MIRITAGALARFTSQAAQIANRSMPIMAATKLDASGQTIRLNAAGLECRFEQVVNIVEAEPCCLALDSEILFRISKCCDPEAVLEITPKDLGATVRDPAGAFSYDVTGLPPEDFPKWRDVNQQEHPERNVSASVFFEAIDGVAYAVAKTDPRRVFLGVGVFIDGATIRACGTDGKMLAVARRAIPSVDPDYRAEIVLPVSAIARLRELIGGSCSHPGTEFGFSVAEGFLRASGENPDGAWLFEANGIEGRYPNVGAVIPKEPRVIAKVDPADLLDQIRRARAILNDPGAPLIFDFHDQEMRVEGVSFDRGVYRGSARAETPGGGFRVGFNARYLESTIRSLGEGNPVVMSGTKPESPVLFSVADNAAGDVHLVMPIKISQLGTGYFPGAKKEEEGDGEE